MRSPKWMLLTGAAVLAAALSFGGASQAIAQAVDDFLLPDWAAIFNEDGSAKDELDAAGGLGANGVADHKEHAGGIHAIFLDDIQSDGEAVDLSTYNGAATLAEGVIDNGLIAVGEDLGNALLFSAENSSGALEIFVGIERTIGATTSAIEVEFNQDSVGPITGRPWPLFGERLDGDIKVRATFTSAGVLATVQASVWDGPSGAFVNVGDASAAAGCADVPGKVLACDGSPVMVTTNDWGRWDVFAAPLPLVYPDAFLELAINVEGLVGERPDFRVVQVRSSGDIIMSSLWID